MNRLSLPLHEIIVQDRQRTDLGDIADLAESLKRFGLIQPIVLDQSKRLIAGGRRLAAATSLGWTSIDIVYRETLSQDELHELELEENIRRKQMHWTEECLAIAHIHRLKKIKGLTEGWTWGQAQTAELMGFSIGAVNYILKVASELKKELSLPVDKRRCHKCDSAADAYRQVILSDEQSRITAYLALKQKQATNTGLQETQAKELIREFEELKKPDALAAVRARYEANPHNTIPFDIYWKAKEQKASNAAATIYISNRFFQGDCIAFMECEDNASRFDHILTDIPYGIDMDMLAQENVGMTQIESVRQEHDIEDNEKLFELFFPAAFRCTKPTAFVVTFCDITQWQKMYDLATDSGFAVQRWPLIWQKTNSCMNGAAQYNFTKNYEIAMVCRKPGAVLANTQGSSIIVGTNEKARKETGHPFAKSYEVTNSILNAISIEGQSILDPFCGRGSMVIEALRTRRNAFGCELNVEHFNALMENVKQYYLSLNRDFKFQ